MSTVDSIHSLAQTVAPGTVLFEEGTAGGGIIVLLAGRLNVLKGGHVVGSISEPGSYVGESTFVTGRLRSATVIADNSATIIRLSAQQSAEFLQSPGAETKMIKAVTERLDNANDAIRAHAERAAILEEALRAVLTRMKVLQDDLQLSQDNPTVVVDVARQIRVLVNKYGTAENVKDPIVI